MANHINKPKCIEFEIRGKSETAIQEHLKTYYPHECFLTLGVGRGERPFVTVFKRGTHVILGYINCDWLDICPY